MDYNMDNDIVLYPLVITTGNNVKLSFWRHFPLNLPTSKSILHTALGLEELQKYKKINKEQLFYKQKLKIKKKH